jgi:fructose-1,6-bisphosphatase/inositol monophosphatase family enzyme
LVLGISADLGEKEPALKFVRETILNTSNSKTSRLLKAGACGNKCLKVIQGEADCALMNFGCSLWDTCATEALVVAAGGDVCTLLGWKIHHGIRNDSDKETYKNRYGVLVTGKNFQTKHGVTLSAFIQQYILKNKVISNILKQKGEEGENGI